MATWAKVATMGQQQPAEPSQAVAPAQEKSCAVIDTNAIIDGSQLQLYGGQLATIPEVLKEVRDKKTRDFLEKFPFTIQSMDPNPESLRAGTVHIALPIWRNPTILQAVSNWWLFQFRRWVMDVLMASGSPVSRC